MRAALVLTITAFVPLVCVLAIWPRMAGGALHLAEFVIGLLLSKFVVATAFVVGLSLLLPAVLGTAFFRLIRRDRFFLAVSGGGDPLGCDPVDQQNRLDCRGPLHRQLLVLSRVTDRIGVTFEEHVD